jgi:hypothetical protein
MATLPVQKLPLSQKNKSWREASLDYYIAFRYTNGSGLRSDRNHKLINYDLMNGIVNQNDISKICDPLGTGSSSFDNSFMHHDKISPIIHELLGEESIKPDTTLVFSEAPDDLNRKQTNLKKKILDILMQNLQAEIDPDSVDKNNPPQTPDEILKNERYSPSDMIEKKANKILKILKKRLNTKWLLNQGFKDALIAGEECYWMGITNGEPDARKVNPLNLTVILDDDNVFIDDAIAVIEERLLTIPSILDEYGDELTKADLDKLDTYSRGSFGTFSAAGGFDPIFQTDERGTALKGVSPTGVNRNNNSMNYAIRVCRVEWISMKLVATLKYTDEVTGEPVEKLVDETFFPMWNDFKSLYPDAELEKYWINESWEGVRIAQDIYIGIRAKPNQRRRMDNPYYCQLGYTGFIYEATNSRSVSLVDRLKSYQYLYDIISYKLQLVFASDIGKVMLMDLAQIPRSEGIDVEQWLYYLKETKIAFINSFEEGRKGMAQGKMASAHFNQFNVMDMSLAQSVQQYMNYLSFIDQQIYNVSGVNQQRLGKIHQDEAVSNVEQARASSETITQYLFDAHQEIKRRFYTGIIEVAKIAWKKGLVTQYVNDDLGLEILQLDEFEFENSEFSVFISNLTKDKEIKQKLDQLAQVAMEQQKADLSTIIDTVLNDSPKDIVHILKKAEADFYQRQQEQAKSQQEHEQQIAQMQQQHEQAIQAYTSDEKQKDRDLQQYIADENNKTKLETAEMTAFALDKAPVENISNTADNALKQQELSNKIFLEQQKLASETNHNKFSEDNKSKQHNDKIQLEKEKLSSKEKIEKLKIEATKIQDKNQIELANKKHKADKELADKKIQIEKMKIKAKPKTNKK